MAETIEQLSDAAWELRESEERYRSLVEARQKAEEASAAKSRVLATVSHEFRTPLNGILGLTGLLLETSLTPDQETYARAVHSSGEALLALVDDMLDFSRIEAGRLELHPGPTDIEALLQEIAAKHFFLETLETRNSDSLDFHEVAVWSIRSALEEAFAAGQAAAAR